MCIPKEPRGTRRTVYLDKENVSKETEITKSNQTQVLEQKGTVMEMKFTRGARGRCEQEKKKSANLEIGLMTLPSLRSRKKRAENELNLGPHGASVVQQPQREEREEKGQREDRKRWWFSTSQIG